MTTTSDCDCDCAVQYLMMATIHCNRISHVINIFIVILEMKLSTVSVGAKKCCKLRWY